MSFAKSVKDELINLKSSDAEQLAELSALLHLHTSISINNEGMSLQFTTNNAGIARRFVVILKHLYQSEIELLSKSSSKLRKRGYIVNIKTNVKKIVEDHSMFDQNIGVYEKMTQTDVEKRAYIRGCFLSSGSINDPSKPTYHLEIFTEDKIEAIFIQRLMNHFDLNAKITKRRKGLIIYLKEAEAISNFLSVIGANESMFRYEDIRIKRDFNNSINRLINIEIANERKTLTAANKMLKDIEFIRENRDFDLLDQKLKDTIVLRESFPDASLNELIIEYKKMTGEPLSKSGMNHRLVKIKELADQIREGR
ncbi:MAG: DNA-binding protein WhiA [Paracholeplasma sp.]|uniref:Probable cell division protein WhiA n=1 Tax=Acholeplasma brassicae TaxID=61635 RepID=U4KQB0_9MOLU|nr:MULTISPECIES: DNA-binding protein WhiA [Paracholeplasma]MDY3195830.1 DNA-binding protein WhiA [Paracholeplasma sp.]CCV66611.1 Putative sporulation transcription regulator WhiA [Paracholeplasma brassicae]